MRRYYISSIVGDGSIENPYRPKVANYPVGYSAAYPPQDMTTGKYTMSWCLVVAVGPDHRALTKDLDLVPCPDLTLDARLDSTSLAVRDAWLKGLSDKGVSTTNIKSNEAYRLALRVIGQQLDPAFHEDGLGVTE